MIATGAKGIGYKGSPLSFMENVNGSGKPGIWQSDKMEYMFLTMKWQANGGPDEDYCSPHAAHEGLEGHCYTNIPCTY
jgi:hypothetical protein